MGCLVLGASQASALPPVQVDPLPRFLLAQAAQPEQEPAQPGEQAGAEQQATFAELNELLEATRAKLDELTSATAIMSDQRKELEALKQETERLAAELEQANARRTGLEESSKAAEARIAELTKAVDVAVQETVRIDEELAGVRRQNAELEERLARAEEAREAALAGAEETRTELEAKLEAATAAAEQARSELAELRQELERTGEQLATAERARAELTDRASEMEGAAAAVERLQAELAQAEDQLGQTASAAVEAERARQAASSEADELRAEAERAREELAAVKREVERFRTANAQLERQVASLHGDSQTAMQTARQNLVVMEQKIEELNAALAGAGLVQEAATERPQATPASVANERSTGSNLLSGMAQQAAPGPEDKVAAEGEAGSAAQLAARESTAAPAEDDGSGLERFDANVRYLNSRAFEAAGAYLFSGIEPAGDGVVHVSTTIAWQDIPPAGQRSYLNSLFDLWTVAQDGAGPAVVRIVDPSGRVLLEKSDDHPDD